MAGRVSVGGSNFPVIEKEDYTGRPTLSMTTSTQNSTGDMQEMPDCWRSAILACSPTLLSAVYPLKGICLTIQSACASATQAIGEAYQYIRHGHADLMVAGGADSMLSAVCVTGFTLLSVVSFTRRSYKACRPFDRKRDGSCWERERGSDPGGAGASQTPGAKIYAK